MLRFIIIHVDFSFNLRSFVLINLRNSSYCVIFLQFLQIFLLHAFFSLFLLLFPCHLYLNLCFILSFLELFFLLFFCLIHAFSNLFPVLLLLFLRFSLLFSVYFRLFFQKFQPFFFLLLSFQHIMLFLSLQFFVLDPNCFQHFGFFFRLPCTLLCFHLALFLKLQSLQFGLSFFFSELLSLH